MLRSTLRGLVAATALLVAASSTAEAQMDNGSRFALQGGVAMPTGDLGDIVDMGFQVGGAYFFKVSSLNMRVNADWTRHSISDVDGSWTQLGAMVNALLPFGSGLHGLVGLGFYNQTVDIDGFGSESEADLAWNVGAGYGKGKWYVEARYQSIMTEGEATTSLPIVFGWRF